MNHTIENRRINARQQFVKDSAEIATAIACISLVIYIGKTYGEFAAMCTAVTEGWLSVYYLLGSLETTPSDPIPESEPVTEPLVKGNVEQRPQGGGGGGGREMSIQDMISTD